MRDYSVSGLTDAIASTTAFHELVRAADSANPGDVVGPLGLVDSVRPAVVAALAETRNSPVLWVTSQPDEARTIADALRAYLTDPQRVALLPAPDALPYERIPWDPTTREQRMDALAALHRGEANGGDRGAPVVVAPLRGLMQRSLPADVFARHTIELRVGDRQRVTELLIMLASQGYDSATTVSEPGQVAHRGGILDVYPPSDSLPTRLEWFGDEIDSMRHFDPTTQRSMHEVQSVFVVPASEALLSNGPRVAGDLASVSLARLHPIAQGEFERNLEHLRSGDRFPGIELYGPLLHPEPSTAIDYLSKDSLVVIDDLEQLRITGQGAIEQASTLRDEQVHAGELPEDWPGEPLVPWSQIESRASKHVCIDVGVFGAQTGATLSLAASFSTPPRYRGRIEEAALDVSQQAENGRAVVVVSRQAPRMAELLDEVGLSMASVTELPDAPGRGGIAVVHGTLTGGWILSTDSRELVVVTDGELFGWRMPHSRRRARRADASKQPDFFAELAPGTHVVHIEHGIGVFRGLNRMKVGDAEREYLQIEYAQGDMLYVPTHQADRVARYVGAGESSPAVTRLGTPDWERAKKRARRAVEDIARELLAFYARREMARRTPFSPDTPWQAEMEAAFPYVETDDQLRAIEAVKRDMEGERPMDRLVVGDVGFGKTEVALRAAFKAVMAGRQVAVLTPTTVLSQQHYDTFRQRLAAFPVRIEMLSRYRTRAEQSDTIERLADREVDIVIGTHRLLSPDVKFHDLGLLIVDEEHRFGVKHKERLRAMSESVDTLTLTATPIPRTMHMALSGLRDLTTIDTPPEERLPVVTHVGPMDDGLVRQAIRRELSRRGQVFYVFNRVRGIDIIAQRLNRLVPEARIDIAHGQMNESELARAMLDFVAGSTDVLVCTSIIESGLDIQNANTLVVERADRFGLAQLHQLRGRVGRSAQRAYAYFLYPPGHEVQAEARERLEALAEAHELGSGLRLAMRDLEIRGAGEILGARQHGQVVAIGLDLYTRLLAEAIKKLQADGPAVPDVISREIAAIDPGALPTVDLPLDAHLPEAYVSETSERTRIYRRMAIVDDLPGVDEVAREMKDRFGPPPPEVASLIAILRLRVLAHVAGARSVGFEGGAVVLRWSEDHELHRPALKDELSPDVRIGRHQLALPVSGPPNSWLGRVRHMLEVAVRVESTRSA